MLTLLLVLAAAPWWNLAFERRCPIQVDAAGYGRIDLPVVERLHRAWRDAPLPPVLQHRAGARPRGLAAACARAGRGCPLWGPAQLPYHDSGRRLPLSRRAGG